MKLIKTALTGALVVVTLTSAGVLFAQAPGITRTIVMKGDLSDPTREGVLAKVDIVAGSVVGWHTHPGDEIGYISDGELVIIVAGQSTRKVGAGQGWVIPAGVVHNAKNEGASAVKAVISYYVEKGKPLASPAPEPKL
ncbi:MAG: cupin domain-containing protein [Burkholderiales bacterium]